jgi:hypothetical protein
MQLPFIDSLQVDEAKITTYLLNDATSRGKAAFFLRLGFQIEQWQVLAEALKAHARNNPVTSAVDSPYGRRYSVDGPIDTPDKRDPRPLVRAVWIVEHESQAPRLITAYPAQEAT